MFKCDQILGFEKFLFKHFCFDDFFPPFLKNIQRVQILLIIVFSTLFIGQIFRGYWRMSSTYMPSPPQVRFGVMVTSLHPSVSTLYTYSLRGRFSWDSIKENKSSDWNKKKYQITQDDLCELFGLKPLYGLDLID